MKKEVIKTKGDIGNISFISFIIILSIELLIVLYFGGFYYNMQESFFSTDKTMLFIHDTLSKKVIVFSPFIILFCIALDINSNIPARIMNIKICIFISIITFVISLFILIYSFFEYANISKEGIYVRNGIVSTEKSYTLSDIEYIEVSYDHGYKNQIDIIYSVHLNDGTILDACNSKDFFSKITDLDKFMKDKNIKIVRSTIKQSDYGDFEKRYKGDSMQVILEILNK